MAGEGDAENDQANNDNGHNRREGFFGRRRCWLEHGGNDAWGGGRQNGIQGLPLHHAFAPHQFGPGQFAPVTPRLQFRQREDAQVLPVVMEVIVHGDERNGGYCLLAHAQFFCGEVHNVHEAWNCKMGVRTGVLQENL